MLPRERCGPGPHVSQEQRSMHTCEQRRVTQRFGNGERNLRLVLSFCRHPELLEARGACEQQPCFLRVGAARASGLEANLVVCERLLKATRPVGRESEAPLDHGHAIGAMGAFGMTKHAMPELLGRVVFAKT